MDRGPGRAALRRRLAETHLRAEVYREETLRLHREGVGTQDPRFVGAFMAAKAAHRELEARLKSRARLEVLRQHAACVKIRVDEQAERRDLLIAHRRYLDPAFGERLDEAEDRLADQEEQLEEAAANACLLSGDDDPAADGWMSAEDSDLLIMWQLGSAPAVRPGDLSGPGSRPTSGPVAGGLPGGGAPAPPGPGRPGPTDPASESDCGSGSRGGD
ncbi:UL14 [Papiine alphaherpesvirus 2]|uniref:UL14 n=1 Tax=Cercopithecine herpesvirus 16 TaxID=340907 RepID=Q2QBG3_CHV16|nr:tegument protein UL14 [Papiine alphaherpesvirus 2]UYB79375.1 tegument protein UL14 [synthetic construct]ABA29267.1 UL14 [Papiine alphaherpesvirus 2]AHM95990.1 tegument protein UL14 [Papiine alphaherpesvirus 2]AHM96062.1 tegument protein UL14 [Papiine alphaherpesvirus 2]UYB79448.1 tegument protein UL14 [synthetic construct]